MNGSPELNGHCDVCGYAYWYDEHEESSDCPRCEKAKAAICRHDWDLMSWVQAVAQKAAADALDDMRTELRRREDP